MPGISNAARLILFCVNSPNVNVSYTSSSWEFADSWIGAPARGYGRMFNPRAATGRMLLERGVIYSDPLGLELSLTNSGRDILAKELAKGYRLVLEMGRKPQVVRD